jgi:predicted lysophospholipase L1 biosynthesis ABC-type transport system permease subunit
VVNQTFVRKVLGGVNPIGKILRTVAEPDYPATEYRIVGLVKDAKYSDIREEVPQHFYAPLSQDPNLRPWTFAFIRSDAPTGEVVANVKQALTGLNPDINSGLHGLERQIRDGLTREGLMAALSGFFGVLAALLATIGLYGVISYIVARRRNEIGVRIALGASRGQVVGMVMRDAAKLLVIGVVAGTGVALLVGRSANALLFGLKAWDPWTIAGAAGLLAAIAALASFVPATRAAKVDAMQALRWD